MMIETIQCRICSGPAGRGPRGSQPMYRRSQRRCPPWPILVAIAAAVSPLLATARAQADAYDLRSYDRVTPVKDQNPYSNCWAYATMSSIESNMLTRGLLSDPDSPSADYSEAHLSRFYNGYDVAQPITGGGRHTALSYFSRGRGPVLESQYSEGNTGDLYASHDYQPQCWVTAQQWIDRDFAYHPATFHDIKNTIVAQGAVVTGMYWHDYYYDSYNYTYYYSGGTYTNHAVSLVGWDDDKEIEGTSPGAWLVKNSWGTSWGDDGYFWLSYDDTVAVWDATSYQTAAACTYNEVFENQTDSPNGWLGGPSYGAARFTSDGVCFLKAVGFATDEYGIQYDVSVYDSWSSNRPSGLLGTETGSYDWPGYYLVDLDTPILLGAEDEFVVVLHFSGGVGSGYYLAVDSSSGSPAGVSYYSWDGSDWDDMASAGGIFFLKTFVGNIPGDANRDGAVDAADAAILADNWGQADAKWAMGDFDCDGLVGPKDAAIMAANWGYDAAEESGASAVPEPSTMVLVLSVLVTWGILRSRPAR